MFRVRGTTACRGVAAGPIRVITHISSGVCRTRTQDAPQEWQRVEAALQAAKQQLDTLAGQTRREQGGEAAAIFEIHRMMLEDADYLEMLRELIFARKMDAGSAVGEAGKNFAGMLEQTGDDYMRARAADVRDVSQRLIDCLNGTAKEAEIPSPVIAVADELLPGELLGLGRNGLSAVVMRGGSVNSHACILARAMKIPTLVCADVDLAKLRPEMTAVVDADAGEVVFEPDAATLEAAAQKAQRTPENRRERMVRPDFPIKLCINIGSADEADAETLRDTDGVGLFRTEFLFLGRAALPDEEEQYDAYTRVLRTAGEKEVVIRTFDLGADKPSEALLQGSEKNPALGCRGIRLYSVYPEAFRTQLRALLRAAVHGDLRILYPMITDCREVRWVRQSLAEAAEELRAEGLPFRMPKQGVMIETPAAVMIADELAELVDFFSVGTNDLIQYTLACDREGGAADCFDPHHPAVLRMIRMAAESAHRAGRTIEICGELAADPELTAAFAEMRIDGLSMTPSALPAVEDALRRLASENGGTEKKA